MKFYRVREDTVYFVFLRCGTDFGQPHSSGTSVNEFCPRSSGAMVAGESVQILGYLGYMTLPSAVESRQTSRVFRHKGRQFSETFTAKNYGFCFVGMPCF